MGSRDGVIGIIGGMSWESSALYYRRLNEGFHRRLSGHHNARSVLVSVDYDEMLALAGAGDWPGVGGVLADAAQRLERAGAAFALLAANTAHVVAGHVAGAIGIPLLHIADPTADAIRRAGLSRVGLIGTRFTMEMDFLTGALRRQGIEVDVPATAERHVLHRIIVRELTLGVVRPGSRRAVEAIMARLVSDGAQGVVIGCTEIPLLLGDRAYAFPTFDTTALHVHAAIEASLSGSAAFGKPAELADARSAGR